MNRKAKALEFADVDYHFQITGRHVEITDAMKNYAIEKMAKIERILDRIIDVNIILDIQKLSHEAEIILKAGNFKLTSHATSTDMYVSIDQAIDKLEAQVLRYKSKMQDYHNRNHVPAEMPVNVLGLEEVEEEEGATDSTDFKPHRVLKTEKRPLKTLSYEEAIMKMELSKDAFLIFKNGKDEKLNVIYRRKDGHYGIIEPSC